MKKNNYIKTNYTPKQLKLPIEIEKIIDFSDPVYSFCEIVDLIDLSEFFVKKGYKTGRPRYSYTKLLKIILFSFMENGYLSLRQKDIYQPICRTDGQVCGFFGTFVKDVSYIRRLQGDIFKRRDRGDVSEGHGQGL